MANTYEMLRKGYANEHSLQSGVKETMCPGGRRKNPAIVDMGSRY